MSRSLRRRLEKLERTRPMIGQVHCIMGHSEAELDQQETELKASGRWNEGDVLICRLIVEAVDGRPAAPADLCG